MKPTRQKLNRTSPKSEKNSSQIRSPNITSLSKTTVSNSDGASKYFKKNKPIIPEEAEEESEKEKFLKKHRNNLVDTEVIS